MSMKLVKAARGTAFLAGACAVGIAGALLPPAVAAAADAHVAPTSPDRAIPHPADSALFAVNRSAMAAAGDEAALPLGTTVDTIFLDGFNFEPGLPGQADQRFALMWISGSAVVVAAVRGDSSIRFTNDPGLRVRHVGVGHYCVHATSPSEGAVGVLQNQGGTHGLIDVTMGIGNPCPAVPGAQISVRTWQLP